MSIIGEQQRAKWSQLWIQAHQQESTQVDKSQLLLVKDVVDVQCKLIDTLMRDIERMDVGIEYWNRVRTSPRLIVYDLASFLPF